MDVALPPMNPEVARLRRKAAQRKYVKRLRYVRFLWGIAGLLLLVMAIEVVLVLTLSPRFWIYRVEVSPCDTITKPEIIRLAAVPLHSNFYRLSLGRVAQRISEGDPRVKHVAIRRKAVGVLGIYVVERQPVCRVGDALPPRYVDIDGVLFTRPAPPAMPAPLVEGITIPLQASALGKPIANSRMRSVLACLREMYARFGEDTPLEITRITLDATGRMKLFLHQGTQIVLGAPENFDKKMFMVQQTILFASSKGDSLDRIEYIDASVPERGSVGLAANYKPKSSQGDQEETTP